MNFIKNLKKNKRPTLSNSNQEDQSSIAGSNNAESVKDQQDFKKMANKAPRRRTTKIIRAHKKINEDAPNA